MRSSATKAQLRMKLQTPANLSKMYEERVHLQS